MTRDEILDMPAGREMDALIARYVIYADISGGVEDVDMETETVIVRDGGFFFNHYSTDIKAAWQVVEKLTPAHNFYLEDWGVDGTGWKAFIDEEGSFSDTAPLAICRAALLAVMEETV